MTEQVDVSRAEDRKRMREDAPAAYNILYWAIQSTAGEKLDDVIDELMDEFPKYIKTEADRERLSTMHYLLQCLAASHEQLVLDAPSASKNALRREESEEDDQEEEDEEDAESVIMESDEAKHAIEVK